jgi:hypothetical protein
MEITATAIRQAFDRFEDFQRVQFPDTTSYEEVLRQGAEAALSGAFLALRESVGLSDEAVSAFWERLASHYLPGSNTASNDQMAFIGAIVALTAAQLSESSSETSR